MDFVKFWRRLRPAIIDFVACLSLLAAVGVPAQETAGDAADVDPDVSDAAAQIDRFIADVSDLSATFEQQLLDGDGQLIDEPATGQFLLLRPSRFLWHQTYPYEQIVVADGESLWAYDVELEQVNRYPLSDLEDSPAMLLSGTINVADRYEVSAVDSDDGLRWVELTPLDAANSEFLSASIGFDDANVPMALRLVDGLNQVTLIRFGDIEVNSGLTTDRFAFVPPPGVDVVGEGR